MVTQVTIPALPIEFQPSKTLTNYDQRKLLSWSMVENALLIMDGVLRTAQLMVSCAEMTSDGHFGCLRGTTMYDPRIQLVHTSPCRHKSTGLRHGHLTQPAMAGYVHHSGSNMAAGRLSLASGNLTLRNRKST